MHEDVRIDFPGQKEILFVSAGMSCTQLAERQAVLRRDGTLVATHRPSRSSEAARWSCSTVIVKENAENNEGKNRLFPDLYTYLSLGSIARNRD